MRAENISRIISYIGQANIAEDILDMEDGENILRDIGTQVCEDAERDMDSMSDWSNKLDEGKRIAELETKSKSEPWEGAANFKTPAMLEASVSFGDRASTELLRSRNLVKTDIIGNDPDGKKRQASENVAEHMNYQVNYEMEDWRDVQEGLLYEVPASGCVFKKIYFDSIEKVNRSEVIHYPGFAVNQATKSMQDCLSFTQFMDISYRETREKQLSGLWLDVELYPQDPEQDEGSNEEQEVEHAIDNEERFLEQRCFYDLDGDGYGEPYTVTVHERTRKVVRIVARYTADGVYVKNDAGLTGKVEEVQDATEIVKIKPQVDIVKYGFIRNPDGTFLDIGYNYILASLCILQNGLTNQLLDSGTLSNLQGGFVAKGFRKRMGNLKWRPGSWESTDISAIDLRNGILPHQFKEPSQTLFAMNEKVSNELSELSANMDLQGVLSPNAPATTTLALIQENMVPMSAIMQRIIRAESLEFKKLYELNAIYTDPREYQVILDNPEADYRADYNLRGMDVMPTASAEMSSKIQRLQQSNVMLDQAERIGLLGGDVRPIYERWFDAIGADDMVNQVWPSPEEMSEEQAQRMQQIEQQQKDAKMLQAIQIDQAERELALKEKIGAADLVLKRAELEKMLADLRKTESETILNLEKAETEQTKNQIDLYTAQLEGVRQAIDATIREIEVNNAQRVERNDQPKQASPPNIAGRLQPVA